MPSFGEQVETLAMWRAFPGVERLDGGVALTFDDGPDEDATPAVLHALDVADARATFFMVGEQVLVHHDLATEVVRRGHAVGVHCFRHEAMDRRDRADVRDDLLRALDALEAATGVRPSLFRPPYGRLGEAAHAAALGLGLRVVYWSGWGMDWEELRPERILELARRDLLPGAIVLLHDSARYAHRPSAEPTAAAIGPIAAACAARGLELVALREDPAGA